MARCKAEPGASPPRSTPPRQHSTRKTTKIATRTAPSSAISTSVFAASENRDRRSGAPTVDTRIHHATVSEEVDDDDALVLMEVRPAPPVKPEFQEGHVNAPIHLSYKQSDDIDKNLRDIGKHLKKCNDTLGALQQLGVQHVTNLPELVLVGDQSSGKSSLMSAISQIILPRSDGVCTRCPIHIRLSSERDWRCRVSLQQDYAYRPVHNEPITEADVTDSNPFPPWVRQQREVKEFKLIYSKSDPIDEVIRWAQIAILNHNQNFTQFVPKDWDLRSPEEQDPQVEAIRIDQAERSTDAKFSPNTVAIEVKGPGLPDLSFYDMPGVFRNAKHEEDQFLVKVVENLAKEYISHEKAIILWAVPMNHDPETSSTFTLIRTLQAQYRTIGVLTKADLLPKGGYAQWLAMLSGQQHQVKHGYFITSRTSPSIQNGNEHQRRDRQSLRDEHAAEEAFFNRVQQSNDETRSWPQEFSSFDDRCGVDQLVKFLAQTLAKEFARSLPEVQDKLNRKLGLVRDQLGRLSEMPDNPELEVRRSLMQFTGEVKACLTDKVFSAAWASIAKEFQASIIGLKPKYRVLPDGFAMQPRPDFSDRDSVVSANDSPSFSTPSKRSRPVDLTGDMPTPSAQRRRGDNGTIKVEDINTCFNSPHTIQGKPGRIPGKSLAQIRQLIVAKREAGKPGEVPYDVIEHLCRESVQPWKQPLLNFLSATMHLLQHEINRALDKCFARLKKRQIYRSSKKLTDEFLAQHRQVIHEQLLRNYKIEAHKVYTMDEPSWKLHRSKEDHLLRRSRHFYRWKAYTNNTEHETLTHWDDMTPEARRKEEERFSKERVILGDDPYETEMGVASHVRGYYLTAAMRFIDISAMQITSGFFPEFIDDIDFYLDRKLGLVSGTGDSGVFMALMEEEPSTAKKRVDLKADLQKFETAVSEIVDLRKTVMSVSDEPEDEQMEDANGDFYEGSEDGV